MMFKKKILYWNKFRNQKLVEKEDSLEKFTRNLQTNYKGENSKENTNDIQNSEVNLIRIRI